VARQQALPDLDSPTVFQQTDPSGACQRLFDLAGQCHAAWEIAMAWLPPALSFPPRQVLVAGMGGSAIGGDLLRALASEQATIPVLVHRDYGLPAYAGPQTLVLASSYSGDTEETLSAAEEAHRRGCPMVAVTTGGKLGRWAQEWGITTLTFTYRAQPREALGYSLMLLLGALVRMDLLPDPTPEVKEAVATLESMRQEIELDVAQADNPAKELAQWLCGHLPVVYGAGLLAPVARRWKSQFNENGKSWACFDELPEMDHNAVSGTVHPAGFAGSVRGIFLASDYDLPRNRLRHEISRSTFEEAGAVCRTVRARGNSPLAQMLTCVLLGDAASYYLAMLYDADPTAIPAINALKTALAQRR
jgi:glucose/mannose-6-phosphate isomerase